MPLISKLELEGLIKFWKYYGLQRVTELDSPLKLSDSYGVRLRNGTAGRETVILFVVVEFYRKPEIYHSGST